jgi:DNA invertase Pin-like site-specific DNA recombinase
MLNCIACKKEAFLKIYAYLRVSTDQQAETGNGVESQIAQCQEYAKRMGFEITQFYKDEGISGSAMPEDRPGLLEAIHTLSKGDMLLVAKRDRLARSGKALAFIEHALEKKKAKVVSAAGEGTDGDADDPTAFMMRGMTDLFSEFERKLIKWRTKNALKAKKDRGERVGHIPFGYKLGEDGIHLEPDPNELSILEQIFDLRKEGLSTRKIAEEMNQRGAFNRGGGKWNHASMHRMILKIAA